MGPIFRLVLELENTSADSPSINLMMSLDCDTRIYNIDRWLIAVPFLAPGVVYTFGTRVECVSKMNISDIIKVSSHQSLISGLLINKIRLSIRFMWSKRPKSCPSSLL